MDQTPPQKPGAAGDDNFHIFLHEEKRIYTEGEQAMIWPVCDSIHLAYLATIMPDGRLQVNPLT
jgi:hypothetical protein